MSRLILDPEILARLHNLSELVEFCDESGKTLGYFHPVHNKSVTSPFSKETLETLRQQRNGRPLKDVLNEWDSTADFVAEVVRLRH